MPTMVVSFFVTPEELDVIQQHLKLKTCTSHIVAESQKNTTDVSIIDSRHYADAMYYKRKDATWGVIPDG